MTWEDQHLRTEILHTVLDRAADDPGRPDLFDEIPHLDRLFGGPAGVLAALRYRWNIHLDAKLELDPGRCWTAEDARLELAAEQPALYSVLYARTATPVPVS